MFIRKLLYTDVAVLVDHRAVGLQRQLNKFSNSCEHFELTISPKKTAVMFQGADFGFSITVNSKQLEVVSNFCYLG